MIGPALPQLSTDPLQKPSPRAEGIWAYISPSRLNLWLRCPLAFRLRYIDGIRSPTTPSLFLGQRVHSALEAFYRHRMLGLTIGAKEASQRMLEGWDAAAEEQEFTPESMEADQRLQDQAVSLIAAYVEQLPSEEPPPLAVEATLEAPLVDPFTGEDLGISLLGITDLVLPTEKGAVIVDFKTAAKAAAPLELAHEVQLGCYAFLYRQLTGSREAGLQIRTLVKTKTPQLLTTDFTPRTDWHLRRLFGVLQEYVDMLHGLDVDRFRCRPGWTCGMCDYQDHCQPPSA